MVNKTAARAGAAAAPPSVATPVPGTQTLSRGLGLLRLVGDHQQEGLKLADIVQASGLDRATAHRLLTSMVHEQFIERDPNTKLYRLGVTTMQLGYASTRKLPLVDLCLPMMLRLTRIAGDTAFLMLHQGDYAFCLHREAADFPIKVFTIDVGDRRLLGIGAGGLAILARLPDERIGEIYARHAAHYRAAHFSAATLNSAVRRARTRGYAELINAITPGVSGVGACTEIRGTLMAASFGAINSRMSPSRREELGHLLISELEQLRASMG